MASLSGNLRLVLGDQLSQQLPSLAGGPQPGDVVLLVEAREEATYVRHHPQKLVLFFSAMRHFAERLRETGWTVRYVRLDDPENTGSVASEVARALRETGCSSLLMTEPGEWRLAAAAGAWSEALDVPVEVLEDTRFICDHDTFARWAGGRRSLRMEYFYRDMRRRTGVLMEANGKPVGGQWNFDADNRRRYDAALPLPAIAGFAPDAVTCEVMELVRARFPAHFGCVDGFDWPVTGEQARTALAHFLRSALPGFGAYQDAMLVESDHLFHSRLSAAMNIGLLDPLEVCRAAEACWQEGHAPLNAVEGFIRQILGWREFIRGVYWLYMPAYAERNTLEATRRLPDFYWGAPTSMACVAAVVDQTRRSAYAHHIQRLMITGNFALLAGIRPAEVSEWYLAVYADAVEWVELPNVIGMALHADGGLVGSKPYCASGAYIDRMSDYCGACSYDRGQRSGERACPFNVLYWDFLMRHEERLRSNPRMAMSYRNLDRLPAEERAAVSATARAFLDHCAPEACSA
jgi:deoxyribodipyrimidine photolyase-related protein